MATWHGLTRRAVDARIASAPERVGELLVDADYELGVARAADRLVQFAKRSDTGWLLLPEGYERGVDAWVASLWSDWADGTDTAIRAIELIQALDDQLHGDEPTTLLVLGVVFEAQRTGAEPRDLFWALTDDLQSALYRRWMTRGHGRWRALMDAGRVEEADAESGRYRLKLIPDLVWDLARLDLEANGASPTRTPDQRRLIDIQSAHLARIDDIFGAVRYPPISEPLPEPLDLLIADDFESINLNPSTWTADPTREGHTVGLSPIRSSLVNWLNANVDASSSDRLVAQDYIDRIDASETC